MTQALFEQYPDLMTVKQMQELLQIKRTKAYEVLRTKTIRSVRIGKGIKILKTDVIKFLTEDKAA